MIPKSFSSSFRYYDSHCYRVAHNSVLISLHSYCCLLSSIFYLFLLLLLRLLLLYASRFPKTLNWNLIQLLERRHETKEIEANNEKFSFLCEKKIMQEVIFLRAYFKYFCWFFYDNRDVRQMKSKLILHFLCLLFTVLVIVTTANGDDTAIDTRDGEDLILQCRFSPDFSEQGFIYYWARSAGSRFENVAVDKNSLSSTYKWVMSHVIVAFGSEAFEALLLD